MATIGLDVLRAMEYMHSRGRIHRDVKARPSALRRARLKALCTFAVYVGLEASGEAKVAYR